MRSWRRCPGAISLAVRPILIMILLATQTGSRLAAREPSALRWRIVDPLRKIRPLGAVPNAPVTRADLHAGRNEFEPFQVVLRADDADIADVDIEVSDLRTSRGTEISRNNVTAYLEQFLNITRPSLIDGAPGLWPDPLIPRIDRYAHERRNAFPFVLRRGRNQPLWVEIFVPGQARPGKYLGW